MEAKDERQQVPERVRRDRPVSREDAHGLSGLNPSNSHSSMAPSQGAATTHPKTGAPCKVPIKLSSPDI